MSNEIDFITTDTTYDAYKRGQAAYYGGARIALTDNPYPSGTPQHREWANGYTDAYEEDAV